MRAFFLFSLVICLASAPGAQAEGRAAGEPVVSARLVDNRLEVREAQTGQPIFLCRGPLVSGQGEGVTFAVKIKEQPGGADLVFNFMNSSAEPRPLGSIVLGSFTLGPSITYYDFRDTCVAVPVDYNTYLPKTFAYPGELYSPAWVLASEQYATAVTLQYPMMEYKHDVRLTLASPVDEPAGEGGRGWETTFQFSDSGAPRGLKGSPTKMQHPGLIRPGEVQTYTLSVRISARPQEWMRLLLPYRDHFRATYGGVRYVRRADPVQAVTLAEEGMTTDESPVGFVEPFRPDTHGWTRLSRHLRTENGDFNRVMLVNPTGLYRRHREHNPPFQMATAWSSGPPMATASDRYEGLPAVTTAGKDLGLWWGNSCKVSSSWDPETTRALDPFNPEHSSLALAEIEAAVRAGVSTIVLGNFRHETTPVWSLVHWLNDLNARYPEVRFVTDPSACDVLHGLAPTYVKGWNDSTPARREADLYTIKNPHLLADFLLPGHETWAGFTYDNPRQPMKIFPEGGRAKADMERYAALGYVPCFFWSGKLEGVVAGALSWTTSVPPDLLLNDAPQPMGPGTAFVPAPSPASAGAPAPAAIGAATAQPAGSAAAKPKGAPLSRTGAKVTVHTAPGTVRTTPNEGDQRPDKGEVTEALRRAGTTSAKAATKASKIGPTKVAPAEKPKPK